MSATGSNPLQMLVPDKKRNMTTSTVGFLPTNWFKKDDALIDLHRRSPHATPPPLFSAVAALMAIEDFFSFFASDGGL
jgi:hypothetical protein